MKGQSIYIYNRVKKILSDKDRRWYLFSNNYHRDTFINRKADESIDTWSTECMFEIRIMFLLIL